jgi:phosphatidate cytidylyltransferase
MLKYRLFFGSIMILFFIGLILADGWMDGSLTKAAPNKTIQGVLFTALIALLMIPAQLELSHLIRQTGAYVFKIITIPASVLLAVNFFAIQFIEDYRLAACYLLLIPAFSFLALFFVQARRFAAEGTVRNVGAGFLTIIYLGFLSSFILGIRVLWGPWMLLMFIFTIKSSDIGAYTLGRLFGKHKMAPQISPGKTWEGLAGAVLFAMAVALGFSHFCGIMSSVEAIVFGAVFGVLGQAGDLAESMIKRDAALKDSSSSIPGFGGILDVIDSPLATAPAAFGYIWLCSAF